LGIDDFALRRGKSYGTLLADMVTRRPVDLLAGRHAQVVADWLSAHPGVRPTPCRSPTAGSCGTTSPKPLRNA
jgi:transposase